MFWTVPGYSQASPIESILDKECYTLEELLDEDDLIQECKSLNPRLIQFLRNRSTVEQLLHYIVEAPRPGAEADAKRTYKYPFASCEIFCCEVEAIFSTLVEDENLMDLLFSLLNTEQRPLDAMLAGYFARVVNSLLMRKTADTMAYLERQQQDLLPKMMRHLDTTSVAEILVRVVGADEQTRVLVPASSLQWLLETDVLDMLLNCLEQQQPVDIQKAAADVLTAIAETQLSPLARSLADPEVMSQLFQRAFAVNSSALVPALNVCIALVEPRTGAREAVSPNAGDFLDTHTEIRMKTEAVCGLAENVPQLVAFLRDSGASAAPAQQETPFGSLQPAVGGARLKVVELLAALGRTGMRPAEEALLQHGAVEACMHLFRTYPFNNLLHRHVTSLLGTLLESGADATLEALLAPPCSLLEWLATTPRRLTPDSAAQPATVVTKAWRPGYMGHITQLGNKVQQLLGMRSQLQSAAGACAAWKTFVQEYLDAQNTLQAADAWQCGRPTGLDPGAMESEAEFETMFEDLGPLPGGQTSHSQPDYRYGAFQGAQPTQDEEGSTDPSSSSQKHVQEQPLRNSWDDALGSSDDDSDDDPGGSPGASAGAPATEEDVVLNALVDATAALGVGEVTAVSPPSPSSNAAAPEGYGSQAEGPAAEGATRSQGGAVSGVKDLVSDSLVSHALALDKETPPAANSNPEGGGAWPGKAVAAMEGTVATSG